MPPSGCVLSFCPDRLIAITFARMHLRPPHLVRSCPFFYVFLEIDIFEGESNCALVTYLKMVTVHTLLVLSNQCGEVNASMPQLVNSLISLAVLSIR